MEKKKSNEMCFLTEGFSTDYFIPRISVKIGTLTITENLKTKESFGGTVTELYKAESDTKESLYVKSSLQSTFPMSYVMNPVGEFQCNGKMYYVFKGYDGNLCDIKRSNTKLGFCWNELWTRKQKECFAAKVLLMLLLTLRDCYAHRYSNLDLKPQNILYRIIDDEKARVEIVIIDIVESLTEGDFTISNDVRLNDKGSVFWVSPALLRLFGNLDEYAANNDGSKKSAEASDIYSIGAIALLLYADLFLWKDLDISYDKASSKMQVTSYRDYYFVKLSESYFGSKSDDLNSFSPNSFTFANKPEQTASLVCEMLSFPAIENPDFTRESWLDSIITDYCRILSASDRLPEDLIIPARYLPRDFDNEAKNVLIRLTVEMSECNAKDEWKVLNRWNEYYCVRIARDSTLNVPFTIYHMYPLTDYVYRQKVSDSLYLINDRGIIRFVFYPKADTSGHKSEQSIRGVFNIGQKIEDETLDSLNGKQARLKLTFERLKCKE